MIYFVNDQSSLYQDFETATIQECIDYCKKQSVLGLDIETTRRYPKGQYENTNYKAGLDPKLSKICMIQIGTLEKRFIIDARYTNFSGLKSILEDKNIVKVIHNAKFEGIHFLENGMRIVNVHDTMICDNILYNGFIQSYSLEALQYRYLNIKSSEEYTLFDNLNETKQLDRAIKVLKARYLAMGKYMTDEEIEEEAVYELYEKHYVDKSIRLEFIDIGNKPFTKKQIEYGDSDITRPLQIYEMQLEGRILANGELYKPLRAFRFESTFTQVVAEITWRGCTIDVLKWHEAVDIDTQIYNRRKKFLDDYVIANHPKFTASYDLFTSEPTCAIQWTSSTQVIALFKDMGICPQEVSKTTKKKSYTVGAVTLFKKMDNEHKIKYFKDKDVDEIKTKDDLYLSYLLFKKSEQSITTFGKQWTNKYVHPITGKIHSNYQTYKNTTRLSSTNPNMQNIPGTKQRRACFISPHQLINCDYSTQEIRVGAEFHNNTEMIKFFTEPNEFHGDFHSFSATKLFSVLHNDPDYFCPPKEINGKDNPAFTKQHGADRTDSKANTFLQAYGGGAYTLAAKLGIEEEDAQKIIDSYYDAYPGLRESYEAKKKSAMELGFIQIDSFTDSRYFYPYFDKMHKLQKEAWSHYPENYKYLSLSEKEKIKAKIKHLTAPLWKEFFYYKGKLERKALNYPVQGVSSKQMKFALIKMYNHRWNNGEQDTWWVTNVVHDEVSAESLKNFAEKAAKYVGKYMEEGGNKFMNHIPMKAKAVLCDYWEH